MKKFAEIVAEARLALVTESHDDDDDDWDYDGKAPQHIVDAHHAEAKKRGHVLKRVESQDRHGISSHIQGGGVFSTDHDHKTGKYTHEVGH